MIIGSLVVLLGFAGVAKLLSLPMKAVMTGSVFGVVVTFVGYFVHCWAMTRPFRLQVKVLWGGMLVRLAVFVLMTALLHLKMGWPIAPLVFPMITAYVVSTLVEGVALGPFDEKVEPMGSRNSEEANGG